MKGFWKRAGWAGMCLLALLAALAAQLVGSFLVMLPAGFLVGMETAREGIQDPALVQEKMAEAISKGMGPALVLAHLLMLAVFFLWYYFGCGGRRKRLELKAAGTRRRPAPGQVGVILLTALGTCFLTNGVMSLIYMLAPSLLASYEELMESVGIGEGLAATFAAVCIAPFGEELLFRGTVLYYAEKLTASVKNPRIGFYAANAVQALCFGIFHGNLVQGTYAFFMGLVLGYLRKRYGTVWASIAGHFVINASSVFIWDTLGLFLPESVPVFLIISLVSLAVTAAGLKRGGRIPL